MTDTVTRSNPTSRLDAPLSLIAAFVAAVFSAAVTASTSTTEPPRQDSAPSAPTGAAPSQATEPGGALEPPRRRWEPPPPPPPATERDLKQQELVVKRAAARWEAIRAKQYDRAYEFLSPAGRLVVAKERHIEALKGLPVLDAQVTDALCRNDKCRVTVMQTVEMTVPRVGKKQLRSAAFEQWIVEGDQVWLLVRSD